MFNYQQIAVLYIYMGSFMAGLYIVCGMLPGRTFSLKTRTYFMNDTLGKKKQEVGRDSSCGYNVLTCF